MNLLRTSIVGPGVLRAGRKFIQTACAGGLLSLLAMAPAHAALIGYWKFDEGTGTVANDTSGRPAPLNGTLSAASGGILPKWITGRFGNAVDFDVASLTAGGLVTVPFNSDLLLSNAFTISFWWRPDYVPAASTFPGIVRIGSQSPVPPAANAGWGFFRTQPNTARFKRGNHQPDVWAPAMAVGQWHHIAVTHDGAGNNVAFVNGNTTAFVTNWPGLTTTAVLEWGRMDAFDNAALDDAALFNEGVSLPKMRSLYTVPTSLGLPYDLAKMRSLWSIFDGGPGSSNTVDGAVWSYTTTLPGSTTPGDAYLNGAQWYVVLGSGAGVTARALLLGDVSPGGIGIPGTTTFNESPTIGSTARFIFDLGSTTAMGGGSNDLIEITGDLTLSSNAIVINPLAPLANGTYRLINYTGSKTGNFQTNVQHNSRYTFVLDQSIPNQVNVTVSGASSSLRWISPSSANWDLTSLNWSNLTSVAIDRFFQGDSVLLNDASPVQTNINVTVPVYPSALTVDSSAFDYTLAGSRIGGLSDGLTKNGSSRLSLNGANNFIGPVNLNSGSVRLGHATGLGSALGRTVIADGATLDIAGFAPGAEPITVSGSGLGGLGAIINTGGGVVNNGFTGPITFSGDTTLGGAGRFDLFGGSLVGAGHKLTKMGSSEIALSNLRDTDLGEIDIVAGQLTILGSTTMGRADRGVRVRTNTTFAFWASGTNVHNKPLTMESARLLNSTSGGTDVATNIGAVTLVGTNTVDGGSSVALLGPVTGGAVIKQGTGTLFLGGANAIGGPVTVNAGAVSLVGSGDLGNSPLVTVAAAGRLRAMDRGDQTVTVAPGQLLTGSGRVEGNLAAGPGARVAPGDTVGTLTVLGDVNLSGGQVDVQLSAANTEGAGVNDLIAASGSLNLANTSTLKIIPMSPLGSGPYTVMSYTGSLSGAAANLSVTSDSRYSFSVDLSVPNKVRVTPTGTAAALEWVGGEPGSERKWDVNATPNWLATGPETFFSGDSALFNDFATEFDVQLVGDLYPAETRVAADFNNYTFTGAGRIRGGGLVKTLGGKLTLANSGVNDYPGGTFIQGGTLQVGDGGLNGNLGPNTITNDGTLVLNRANDMTFANTMLGGGTFRKEGTNLLLIGSSLSGFTGTIVANGGMLRPTAANGLGTTGNGTRIGPGATLDINALNLDVEPITAEGAGVNGLGAIVNNAAGGQNQALRNVTLSADATVGGISRWDIRNPGAGASLNGGGFALTKVGANQVSLVGLLETDLGDINVRAGVLSVESSTTLGRPTGTATISSNATLMFWGGSVVHNKPLAIAGGGRLFKDNGNSTNLSSTALGAGSNIVDVASNGGAELTLGGPVTGAGRLVKNGAGNLNLLSDNSYTGGTTINAGMLQVGDGGTNGAIVGGITNNSVFSVNRSDLVTLSNVVTGTGNIYVRTTNGLVIDGSSPITIDNGIEVGRNVYGKMIVKEGARIVAGRIMLGNIAATPGDVVQEGGDVIVSLEARVGHWPSATSTYLLGGGTLSLTNVPTGTAAERNGILYIGVDGTGIFTQTGGLARAHGIVLDNRSDTPGTDTFTLNGGTFEVGPSGITSANPTYEINLGGGRLVATADWLSNLRMTLTGTNGLAILSNSGSNTLSGVLSGSGGLHKQGAGTLYLNGLNAYSGETRVSAGTLSGNGTLAGAVNVLAGSTLSPGPGLVTLTVNAAVNLQGTTIMDIQKTGAVLTNDLLAGITELTQGGSLVVRHSGSVLETGDVFRLFNAGSLVGAFTNVTLPALPAGRLWDKSRLAVDGTIAVIAQSSLAKPTLSGGNLNLAGSGGTPGAPYRILSSDDIAAPIGTWTVVSSGNYDGSGNFAVSLPTGADPERFYVVVAP